MGNRRTYLHFEICFQALTKKRFTKSGILSECEASERTYERALSDFRCYLAEIHPELEVVFDRRAGEMVIVEPDKE